MKCFFALRNRAEREELIMLAQQLLQRNSEDPANPAG
jgi:hypothetical protein